MDFLYTCVSQPNVLAFERLIPHSMHNKIVGLVIILQSIVDLDWLQPLIKTDLYLGKDANQSERENGEGQCFI